MTPGARVAVPIPFYVIEHPDGVALFDCGLPNGMLDRGEDYLQRLQAGGSDVSLTEDETVDVHLKRLDIDPGVLRAFLDVTNYVHGARSMESIVDMSALSGRLRYERSALPPRHQIGLHTDPDEFLALVHAQNWQPAT